MCVIGVIHLIFSTKHAKRDTAMIWTFKMLKKKETNNYRYVLQLLRLSPFMIHELALKTRAPIFKL